MLILSLLWKIALSERKGEEGKKWFFEESRAEIGSRCAENVPPMALLYPTEAPKRGVKDRLKRGANGLFKNIINIFDIKTQYKKGGTTGIKEHFPTLYGVKQQEKQTNLQIYFYTNIQLFTNNIPFILERIFYNTRVSLRVSVIKCH